MNPPREITIQPAEDAEIAAGIAVKDDDGVDISFGGAAKTNTDARLNTQDRAEYWEQRGYGKAKTFLELLNADLELDFLIDRCLVRGMPCVIAGASKAMKTTTSLHLATSLAIGSDFLGRFNVSERQRVLIASAESGEVTIRRNLVGMANSLGYDAEVLDGWIAVQDWVPRVESPELIDLLLHHVELHQSQVVILDPLYLMLSGQNQANVSGQGAELSEVVNKLIQVGVTPIVDDHTKRSSENAKNNQPLELNDITGAGKAEFFRQWMLLSRRSKFESDEDSRELHHDLWATIGGSPGFHSTWGLDIWEDFTPHFDEVTYRIHTSKAKEVREEAQSSRKEAADQRDIERQQRKEQAAQAKLERDADSLLAVMKSRTEPMIKSDIAAALKLSNGKAGEVIFYLEDRNHISKTSEKIRRGKNSCEAWIPTT